MFYCTLLVLVVCRQAAESCPEDCFLPPVQGRAEGRGHDQTGRPGQLLCLFVIFFTFLFLNYIAIGEGGGGAKRVICILSFFKLGGGGGCLRGLVALFATIFVSLPFLKITCKWVSW